MLKEKMHGSGKHAQKEKIHGPKVKITEQTRVIESGRKKKLQPGKPTFENFATKQTTGTEKNINRRNKFVRPISKQSKNTVSRKKTSSAVKPHNSLPTKSEHENKARAHAHTHAMHLLFLVHTPALLLSVRVCAWERGGAQPTLRS